MLHHARVDPIPAVAGSERSAVRLEGRQPVDHVTVRVLARFVHRGCVRRRDRRGVCAAIEQSFRDGEVTGPTCELERPVEHCLRCRQRVPVRQDPDVGPNVAVGVEIVVDEFLGAESCSAREIVCCATLEELPRRVVLLEDDRFLVRRALTEDPTEDVDRGTGIEERADSGRVIR